MPAASGASPPATPPAAASGMCGGAPCCVAAAGSDVAAAGAGPGSVAARAKKWSAARAAQRTGASSRCGAQYGEFALRPARALSLASRLRWLAPKSFLSVRFSCFSSKRPNSAAMTDVGAARVRREAFALASLGALGVQLSASHPGPGSSEAHPAGRMIGIGLRAREP